MLKIGDFSKLSRVSIRMLRHYDEIGLLRPARIDPESGYRYYSETQLLIVCRISALERLRKDDETMKYDVTLKTFPERYAATVRMHIPVYEMEGILWDVLVRETASLHLIPAYPCYCSVVFSPHENSDPNEL